MKVLCQICLSGNKFYVHGYRQNTMAVTKLDDVTAELLNAVRLVAKFEIYYY